MIPRSPQRSIELLAPLVPMWLGRWWFDAVALVALGEAYLCAGELVQARSTLEQAIEVAQPRGMLFMVAPAQRLLGEVLLATNALDECEMRFRQAIELLDRFRAEYEIALARAGYGRLLQHLGRATEARECFDRAIATFERLGTLNQSEKLRDCISTLPVG
jgi:tetratricopeptide (TPR) repeat protein